MISSQENEISFSIPKFYEGRSVFITGFTGYLGKLIVEKLLYSCPGVNKIYVLIRTKKGQTPVDRSNKVLQSLAFDRVREKYPGVLESKIVPLAGDLLEDGLGLSLEDKETLIKEVSVVFHGAASVRFDDPLTIAIRQNLLGAKKIVDLALEMTELASLVYISTAYSNCDNLHIKEEIYPPKADWQSTLNIVDKIDEATIEVLAKKYNNVMPNTYTFTKSLSENVINDHRDRLPVVIVRPSIVISSMKEPIPGWMDSLSGPIAMLVAFLLGLIRCTWVDVNRKCNYIHSDTVVNATIIASWKRALQKVPNSLENATVYNICSPYDYNMNHREFSMIIVSHEETRRSLAEQGINFIDMKFSSSKFWFKINVLYRHIIPALFIDSILVLLKKDPLLLKIRRKLFIAVDLSLSYFTHRTFTFEDNKFTSLLDYLLPEDKESFSWCFNSGTFPEVCSHGFTVAQKTILKPLYDDFETNKRRLLWLYCVDRSSVFLTYFFIAWVLYYFSLPKLLISTIIHLVTL